MEIVTGRLVLIVLSIIWNNCKPKAFEHYAGIIARCMYKSSRGCK